jgi:hypothetical protein
VYRLPGDAPVLVGKPAFEAQYRVRFEQPGLHVELLNRMVFGRKVIDHELVTGVPGSPREVAAIYEVTKRGIAKVWFVSAD